MILRMISLGVGVGVACVTAGEWWSLSRPGFSRALRDWARCYLKYLNLDAVTAKMHLIPLTSCANLVSYTLNLQVLCTFSL